MPFNNGPKIVTTGLSLLADASDQLSYPGPGTAWTDVITGTTASLSGSISFTTDFQGSLVTANSSSVIIFPPSTANFGTNTFTVEFAFRPSQINGQHWILSKNSGSFPNWGVFVTGSSGIGRLVAFFNISSAVSCSLSSAQGSIVTGSNYIVDVSLNPSTDLSRLYINSETAATGSANGTGSLSATAPLFFSNINSGSNSGIVNNVFNIKAYTPGLNRSLVRQNYNAIGNRFGLSSKPFILANLLLDIYAGAAAAYSLRQLSINYDSSAIRVRRSSDNTEANIGFDSNGNLDTAALLSFCGAGNGFVTTWYDQSGNGRNMTQSTAGNQPQIVSAGSVILFKGKPSIKNNGSGFLINSSTLTLSSYSIFIAGRYDDALTSSRLICFGNNFMIAFSGNTVVQFSQRSGLGSNTISGGNVSIGVDYLQTFIKDNLYYRNSVDVSTVQSISGFGLDVSSISLFSRTNGSNATNSTSSEFVVYSSDQSSNRTGIEANINTYYNIY